jgi:DNA repair photolyase
MTGWPTSSISNDTSLEASTKALREGPYGRCVYHCDNNVVDHQVVNIEFENEVPPPHERMEALAEIKKQGIICGIQLMPIIPYINSSEHSLEALFSAAKEAGADYVLAGALNTKNKTFYDSVRQSFPGEYGSIRALYADKNVYKEYREDLAEVLSRVRKRYSMPSFAAMPRRSKATQMSFL